MTDNLLDAPKEPMIEKVRIRTMQDKDFNFIINSWLKSYKYSGSAVRRMRDSDYYIAYEPIVKVLIQRSDIYVACLREEPEVILGYIAVEPAEVGTTDVIHYLLVKDLWQRIGIGKYLLQAADPGPQSYFTHWTSPMDSLANKITYRYNPFLIYQE